MVEVMHDLESNATALLERQVHLKQWYEQYMHDKIAEMEDALLAKMSTN